MVQEINLPTTIEQKEHFKNTLIESILEGNVSPLEFYRQAKLITDVVEEVKKHPKVFEYACEQIAHFPKEKALVSGSMIEVQSRSTPNYEACGDSVWNDLKRQIKEREAFLKTIPAEGTANVVTGEIIKPPTFSTTSFIKVKI